MPPSIENTELIARLQRINTLLGDHVIGIETGGDLPIQVRIDKAQLADNFRVMSPKRPLEVQRLFLRQVQGIRQLLDVAELAKEDRSYAKRELFYTQVLLTILYLIQKVVGIPID